MADRRRGLTRRGLLRAGGAGAGALALGGSGIVPVAPAAAANGNSRRKLNFVLIAVDGIRADFVGAYDDSDERANTPNLDKLAKDSLRFERAVPESMPALPAHRGLISGVRSFPFRDWTRSEDYPPYPGWNPVRGWQPSLPGVLDGAGIKTVWISDNPVLEESRFENVYRRVASRSKQRQMQRLLAPVVPGGLRRAGEHPIRAAVDAGMKAIDELRGNQFFLAVDVFDRIEATDPTPLYVRDPQRPGEATGSGELGKTAPAAYRPDEAAKRGVADSAVRDEYAREVTAIDTELGRLLDRIESRGLHDDTVVMFVSPTAVALGEHGVYGSGPAAGHPDAYRVACMIRDPGGRRAGEPSQYFAYPHDVATTALSFMRLRRPGKLEGEDLTALLDNEDPAARRYWSTGVGDKVVVGDDRYVLVSDFEGQEKRIFDSDPDQWAEDHEGEDKYVERDEDRDVSREEGVRVKQMFHEALIAAGGVLPRFGPNAPIRPPEEVDDDDNETDEGRLDRDDDLNFSGQ